MGRVSKKMNKREAEQTKDGDRKRIEEELIIENEWTTRKER